jgi:hypothetical protein
METPGHYCHQRDPKLTNSKAMTNPPDFDNDPVVFYDPVSGPITDRQLTAICEQAERDQATRDEIDQRVSSRQEKLKTRLNTWLRDNPHHAIAIDLEELIQHLTNCQKDYDYWKDKGTFQNLSIERQRVIVGNIYSLSLAVNEIAALASISQEEVIIKLGEISETRIRTRSEPEIKATIANLENRIAIINQPHATN